MLFLPRCPYMCLSPDANCVAMPSSLLLTATEVPQIHTVTILLVDLTVDRWVKLATHKHHLYMVSLPKFFFRNTDVCSLQTGPAEK